jgi:hypothetical protein
MRLHVALVVDGLEVVLVVLQVHLAIQDDRVVVFPQRLRLRAGVVEAFRLLLQFGQGKIGSGGVGTGVGAGVAFVDIGVSPFGFIGLGLGGEELGALGVCIFRHAEVPAQLLNGRHAGSDGHFFGQAGEGVVQTPGVAGEKLIHVWLKVEVPRSGQQANRQDSLHKQVMDDPLGVCIGERALFELGYFARQPAEVLLKAHYGG